MAEDMLFSGETLDTGAFIENGPYRFIMQNDCNLVLYINQTRALWASGTNGSETVWNSNISGGVNSCRLIVQGDGNVVIYSAALWATNSVQSKRRLL
ncbi:mannose-specific lectin-like [Tasmannia lanceolata]|uniref:mannose-specific lectin-like n=1 Tax=Tasmannia lanceolata TaxID=3420 RepID=UPI0040633C30